MFKLTRPTNSETKSEHTVNEENGGLMLGRIVL